MAGLKPHHRIAMGVSGGADSMALCVLMAHWKTTGNTAAVDSSGFINGLLAIIVDHGLRLESFEEAETVSCWVSDIGIRSEIACCDWPNGRPKLGHLEEMARDMRYQIFQDVCLRHQIGVLLIAHHADDQAELFILRLSRNSGVLGLAGMGFTSQLFPKFPHFTGETSNNQGILLVRPLLEFTKDDLYKICERNNQKWVEDPTNRSSIFTRNRIRMALQDMKTCAFRSELQALISVCRRTRLYVDHICQVLLNQAVTIMPHGYAVIDLEKLNPSQTEDLCLSRFLALVLQFVSQRHRPVRGSALKLLLGYIRTFPCKTSLTAAGCYLCAAPGTKGAKVLVCCSVESVLPSKNDLHSTCPDQWLKQCIPSYVNQIVTEQKSQSEPLVPNSSDVHFLGSMSTDSVLVEARTLKILSESTCETIKHLHMKENQLFKSKIGVKSSKEAKNQEQPATAISNPFQPGQSCYFMNRFLLTWMSRDESNLCSFCSGNDTEGYLRHMIDEDWLYLAEVSKDEDSDETKPQKTNLCSDYRRLSAQEALTILKSIPVAARRGIPVLVSTEGILLSIPSVGFKHCSFLMMSAEFRPRVPLGGGHILFT